MGAFLGDLEEMENQEDHLAAGQEIHRKVLEALQEEVGVQVTT
jgi:hypothetical protein